MFTFRKHNNKKTIFFQCYLHKNRSHFSFIDEVFFSEKFKNDPSYVTISRSTESPQGTLGSDMIERRPTYQNNSGLRQLTIQEVSTKQLIKIESFINFFYSFLIVISKSFAFFHFFFV